MASTTNLCVNCLVAPAWQGYQYCSKRCGREARSGGGGNHAAPTAAGPGYNSTASNFGTAYPTYGGSNYASYDDDDYMDTGDQYGAPPDAYYGNADDDAVDENMCRQCGVRPKFGDHAYCGRTCGKAAKNGVPPATKGTSSSQARSDSSSVYSHSTGGFFGFFGGSNSNAPPTVRCKISSCSYGEDEKGSGYCSNNHRELGVKKGLDPACLYCQTMPRVGDKSHFCGNRCANKAMAGAPLLLEVKETDPRFSDVSGQFKTAWKHTTKPPRVARVYKIILPQKSLDAFDAYKKQVEGTGGFAARGMEPGNERRRWHGTRRQCKIGDDTKGLKPCSNSSCSVCSILKSSYDVKYAATGMFGKGIYTSATSSKSDTYTRGAAPGSPYKSMFLNRVVVGKGKILTTADNTLRAAPDGFNSIIANPGSGLNYDELIVYNNDAIRPSWLLLYDAVA